MGKGGMSQGEGSKVEEENMAAWLVGLNTLKIQPFPLPSLGKPILFHSSWDLIGFSCDPFVQILEGPHDVRVRMKAVGICGSDVHYLKVLVTIQKESFIT